MDTIGSIKDATVRILPSKNLAEYLVSLKNETNVPYTILNFIKEFNLKTKSNTDDEITYTDQNNIIDESLGIENQNFENIKKDMYITVADIKWLNSYLEKHRNEENVVYLHELFEGSEIILPKNEVMERNPELEARCEKLRKNQMNRDYRKMTKNVDNVRVNHPEETIAYQVKNLNKQLIAVGQFIISLGAGFLFGFLGVELMIGNLDFGFRLLLGVMCALIIALAEIYFLAKKLNEDLNINETVQLGGPSVFPNPKKLHKD